MNTATTRTRFIYTVEKARPSGTTYRHVVLVQDYYDEDWQSRSQMRRHFRNTVKRDYRLDWADPTGCVEVESV